MHARLLLFACIISISFSSSKVILDTDLGQDDSWFVAMLLSSFASSNKALELDSVLTVRGNGDALNEAINTIRLMDFIDGNNNNASHNGVHVLMGAPIPLRGLDSRYNFPHEVNENVNKLSGINISPVPFVFTLNELKEATMHDDAHTFRTFLDTSSNSNDPFLSRLTHKHPVDFLLDTINAAPPGTYHLVCLGPLTNIALAIEKERQLLGEEEQRAHSFLLKLAGFIFYGGAVTADGNVPPELKSEYNIWLDAPAAQIVFQTLRILQSPSSSVDPCDGLHSSSSSASPCLSSSLSSFPTLPYPVVMIDNGAAMQMRVSKNYVSQLTTIKDELATLLNDHDHDNQRSCLERQQRISQIIHDAATSMSAWVDPFLYDPLVAVALIDPSVFTFVEELVSVHVNSASSTQTNTGGYAHGQTHRDPESGTRLSLVKRVDLTKLHSLMTKCMTECATRLTDA